MNRVPTSFLLLVALVCCASPAVAQSFGLDDLPVAPIAPGAPIGPLGGIGAEDPFGFGGPPLAPSPSLGFLPGLGDGAILSPGPIVQHPGPNGFYVDSFSRNHQNRDNIQLDFSVDRLTTGLPGTGVGTESGLGQAHGDIFTSTQTYVAPGAFAGTLVGAPFAGLLPSIAGGVPGNILSIDESAFGLLTPAGVVGPATPVPPPITSPALHDNLDSYDLAIFDANGDGIFDRDHYFTIYPDEALAVGALPSDIFVVPAGAAGAVPIPYAPGPSMGLLPFEDSVDALIMFDNNVTPTSGAAGVEPVTDYALFSLAPGSISLTFFGLDAADVFFTDFTGAFGLYAPSSTLGLITSPPGFPFQTENVDALDIVPEPAGLLPAAFGLWGWLTLRRRRG